MFLRLGFDERNKQRREFREYDRKRMEDNAKRSEEKEKEKQMKNALQITYDYTEEEKARAIDKLTIAAKNYDKVFNYLSNCLFSCSESPLSDGIGCI